MGRFGGHETGYGSDADVLFVHDPLPGPGRRATAASRRRAGRRRELRRLLAAAGAGPAAAASTPTCGPEGRQGPLVRTLAAYAGVLRAAGRRCGRRRRCCGPSRVAGDADLGARVPRDRRSSPLPGGRARREPRVREIRRIKARVEAERLPRGADPALHTKLGPRRARRRRVDGAAAPAAARPRRYPGLRTTPTLAALGAAVDAGLIDAADAARSREAWQLATRITERDHAGARPRR